MGTITTFDLDRFTRAAEERDAATQLSMYGPDAVVTINNKVSQPGAPRLRSQERFLELAVQNTARRLNEVQPPSSPSIELPVANSRPKRKRQTS